jgi:uncharacterized protein (DUF1015 family)
MRLPRCRIGNSNVVDAAPFRALRYDPAVAGDPAATSAPAYDELERFTYARHLQASPYTVLELLAPRAESFSAAGAAYDRWRRTGVLMTDERPAYYRYEEHELRHGVPALQRGLLAAVRVAEPDVLAHERVDPARVAQRVRRLAAVPADLAPVFAVHVGSPALRDLLAEPAASPPIVACTDEAGIDHRVWAVREPDDVAAITATLAGLRVVIADGHHRWAAAAARNDRSPGDRTLVYLVDASLHGPQVLPVHRLLRNLPADAEDRLAADFELVAAAPRKVVARLARHTDLAFGLRLPGGRAFVLIARDEAALRARLPLERSAAWRSLDTAVLASAVLPVLGASEPVYRSDAAAAAQEMEATGRGGLFLVRPVSAATVYACAAAGEPMPPKTTWFRPKPRAGLIMRSLDSL